MFTGANYLYGKHKEHRYITLGSNMSWENWENIKCTVVQVYCILRVELHQIITITCVIEY